VGDELEWEPSKDAVRIGAGVQNCERVNERHRGGVRSSLRAARVFACSVVVVASGMLVAASGAASAQPTEPPPFSEPVVSDPMLAPPPAAPRQLESWDEALALLRAHSPDYIASDESVRRAEAQSRIALAAVLPKVTGQAGYLHEFVTESIDIPKAFQFVTPPPNTLSATATLQWNVLDPRAIYALGTSRENAEATGLSFSDRRRVIALALVNDMLSTLAAQRVVELNRVVLRSAFERLTLTQTRLQYLQGTALDVDRAAQDVAAARAPIITGDESLLRAREALGAILGSRTAMAAPGDLRLADFDAAVARTCRLNDDIERRPDVAAARLRAEIAQRGVHDAELMFAPSVSLAALAARASAATLAPLSTVSFQALLTVPIYDGGVRYGALRDSRAALEQARQALVAARIDAVVSSAQAQRSVSVSEASRHVAQDQRDLAARVDQRTRQAYSQGGATSLDLVTSGQALRQAEINLVVLEVQVSEARASAVLTNAECVY
jgi:outer membrane protein TolC